MEISVLGHSDVLVIRPRKHGDERGFLSETYSKKAFSEAGIDLDFVQDNHSFSGPAGTIRGLHYQSVPFGQAKLIRVTRGSIFDVALDLRRASPSFGKWISTTLSAKEWRQVLIPVGYAHGFCTLEPDTEVIYKVTNYYSPQHECGVRWNDPDLRIPWPIQGLEPVLSEKDRRYPLLKDAANLY